jgi:DNA adenine methylase
MVRAEPILKWAGGKRQLLQEIVRRLPDRLDTYFEPFIGGGAVFFELAEQQRFRRAVLSDQNAELIDLYRVVQTDVEALIRELGKMRHSEEEYYRVRASKPRTQVRRAARTVYLNRTGYNGLYRVNRAGEFNVPFGRYVSPRICDPERLRAVAQALSGVRLEVADFEPMLRRATSRDAVYLDPPYVPVSETARFAEYHSAQFDTAAHQRLARVFGELVERGVPVVLSNSDTPLTRELYGNFQHEFLLARRSINSNGTRRGPVKEILAFSSGATGRRQLEASA